MNPPTRQPPRFVPTLTEVVDPRASGPAAMEPGVDLDALIASICQQVQPALARKLQQESEQWLRAALAQHLRDTTARLQSDLESMVRQAVITALKGQNQAEPADAPVNR